MDLTVYELKSLESAKNAKEWNHACGLIRLMRKGQLPPDWMVKVIASGLQDQMQDRWRKPRVFKIHHPNQTFSEYIFGENLPAA